MIKFFGKIRQRLAYDNKPGKYFRYAVGEILLIVIGIFIALQLNNWNEQRKTNVVEIELLDNLLISLQKDSMEVEKILDFQNTSLEKQMVIMRSDFSQLKATFSEEDINQALSQILNGQYSFFPKYGLYNMIVANNGFDILKSKEIKTSLIELYDYKYKRYENIDAVVDQKFQFGFNPFMHRLIGFYSYGNKLINKVNMKKLENNYSELVSNCKDVYSITMAGRDLLIDIQKSVNELITLIKKELKNK